MGSFRQYYMLTKPGIVYGNTLHFVAAGFIGVSAVSQLVSLAIATVGSAFVVAAACVVNNYFDRNIDREMARTKTRGFATGDVSVLEGLAYAGVLGGIGSVLLWIVEPIVFALGILGFVLYAFVYTYSKRVTPHHTLIGAVPGAIPVLAGYAAVTGMIDTTAWLLFAVIFVWQLPHFYAISVFRRDEYARTNVRQLVDEVPLSLVVKLMQASVGLYLVTVIVFAWTALELLPGVLLVAMAIWWAWGVFSLATRDSIVEWSRSVFRQSLVVTLMFVLVAALEASLTLVGRGV